ncbi:MAG: ABC transporter permease subunit [Anaerolineae bacterium]
MNMNFFPTSSRSALRRLFTIGFVVVVFVVYAYGFKVTDVSLKETQDPTRQSSVQRAMRELLSPDIFDQDTTTEDAFANVQKECTGTATEQPAHDESQPYVQLSPDCGARNDIITVEGFNFPINSTGRVFLIRPSGERQPFDLVNDTGNTIFDIDGHGHFQTQIALPTLRGDAGSVHEIQVEAAVPVGLPYFSGTTQTVIEKMVETIFLALIATTLALPVAAFLSFLGAHNLMRDIRIPLGNVFIMIVLLPVGWAIGQTLLGAVGKLGLDLGSGLLAGIGGSVAAIVIFGSVTRGMSRAELKPQGIEGRVREIIISVLLLVLIVFLLGVIGGVGLWLSERLTDGTAGAIGYFLGTVGELIQLIIYPLAGVIGAFYLSSMGTNLTTNVLKSVRGVQSHIAGGVMGAVVGGLVMAGVGVIGSMAALFTVIPPIVAGILGGAILSRLYEWRFEPVRPLHRSRGSFIMLFVGAVATFLITANVLDVLHIVVVGRLPSPDFVITSGIIGVILGAVGGALVGLHASFPMGDVLYNITRTILNALRSIEPLIMGIVFVIWVSIGPFAGVLALTLHSIASLGKLYSEQIESIDLGPIEAIQSTGATRLQTIIYAVVPQIIPPYISFTMYRWDINVRMSTIIGFVGGGGIGFLLQQQINLLRYDQAGVAVLAIAIVVSVLDYLSASIRERFV